MRRGIKLANKEEEGWAGSFFSCSASSLNSLPKAFSIFPAATKVLGLPQPALLT